MAEELSLIKDRPLYCPRCKEPLTLSSNKYLCSSCSKSFPISDGIPQFIDADASIDSFDATFFEFLFQMEQKHFWHVGRREIILEVLKGITNITGAKILEIGCGNGSVLTFLRQNGLDVEGGDIFFEGLKFCRQRAGTAPLYQVDILALPFFESFDVIGLFDVLEHIDDDEKALNEIHKALKPKGKILLTVPAHKFLWSCSDEYATHKRRYSRQEIIDKLKQNGFIIKKASFFISLLFPLLLVMRMTNKILFKRRKIQSADTSVEFQTIPVINEVFLWLLRLEKILIKRMNLPTGASLLVLAEKK